MTTLDDMVGDIARAAEAKDVSWRIVYFRPNNYSDEAISVGVILGTQGRLLVQHVCSPDSLETFTSIFGADTRDQLLFALDALKHLVDLLSLIPPTTALRFGRVTAGSSEDPESFGRDLLRLSSSLFRHYEVVNSAFKPVGQNDVISHLRESVVQLSPFRGRALMNPITVQVTEASQFKVPICGAHTIGAPVSLMTSRIADAIKSAEAFMLRLRYARSVLNRCPHIYVYTPPLSDDASSFSGRVNASLEELRALGESSGVIVNAADTIDGLARAVLRNEKLEPEQLPLQ